MNNTTQVRIIRRPEVRYKVGLTDTTLDNRVFDGYFPSSINLCGRATGWIEHEVDAVLAAMIAGKSKSEIKTLVAELHSARVGGQS